MRWFVLATAIFAAAFAAEGCGGSHHGGSGFAPVTGNPPPPPPPPAPPPPPPGQLGPNDSGTVGSWGQRFLMGAPYTSLLVEVDYISSMVPTQSALNTLAQRLGEHLN